MTTCSWPCPLGYHRVEDGQFTALYSSRTEQGTPCLHLSIAPWSRWQRMSSAALSWPLPWLCGKCQGSSIFSPFFFLGFPFSFFLILPFSSLSLHLLFPTLIFPFLFQVFLAPLFHLCNPPPIIVKCNLLDAFFCDRISSGLRRFCPHRLCCCSSSAVLRRFSHEPQLELGLHIVAADTHTHGWRF